MNKCILFLLFITTFTYSMEPHTIKKPQKAKSLYLVAGSDRNDGKTPHFPLTQLWQENQADLFHTKTYNGKAITIDLEPCDLPGAKHIVGNVCTYKFKENSIKAAYLERLPTYMPGTRIRWKNTYPQEKNYLGSCIENISKAMKKDAKITIEWHPLLLFYKADLNNIESIFDQITAQATPFTGAINVDLVCLSFEIAQSIPIPSQFYLDIPKKFLECACELSETLAQLFTFYEEQNVGSKNLLYTRINQELLLWKEMIEKNKKTIILHGPSASLEDFFQAMKDCYLVPKNALFYEENSGPSRAKIYDAFSFADETLFFSMLSDATAIYNSDHVKKFMEKSGFKNININRTTSKCNGRKNVWIVEGAKI